MDNKMVYFDSELKPIKQNTELGIAKITDAQRLLQRHHTHIMEKIGGDVDREKLNISRLPPAIAKLTQLFIDTTPHLGDSINAITASITYVSLLGQFRPYIADSVVSKKGNIPCNMFVINVSQSGCVDKDTEYCTPSGWKPIGDFSPEDKVLSWNIDGTSKFDEPLHYIKNKAETLTRYKSKTVDMVLSDNHNMALLHNSKNGEIYKAKAVEFKNQHLSLRMGHQDKLPFNFSFPETETSVDMTDDELRLFIAYVADGTMGHNRKEHIHNSNVRIRVKKEHKKIRLRLLLQAVYGEVNERITESEPEYSRFYFKPVKGMYEKTFKHLWKCSARQAKVIAEEVNKWDGGVDKRNGSLIFRTTKKDEADFIQFIWRTTYDEVVTMISKYREDKVPQHTEYTVLKTKQKTIGFGSKNPEQLISTYNTLDGHEYCFTMPNSNWVARRNGKIFLTGNSGKDSSLDLGKEIMKRASEMIEEQKSIEAEMIAKATASKKNRQAQEKAGVKPEEVQVSDSGWEQFLSPPSATVVKMSTYEAFLAECEKIEQSGDLGNLLLKVPELGNALKSDPNIDRLVTLVSEMFDVGSADEDLKKTKELKTGAIKSLGISLVAHTSPAPLVRDARIAEKFKVIIGSFLGRRGFHMVSNLYEVTAGIELHEDIEQQAIAMNNTVHKHIEIMDEISASAVKAVTRLLESTDASKITLTPDARALYTQYVLLGKTYRYLAYLNDTNFVAEGLLAELVNRFWKCIKLAGIWALAENKSVIDVKLLASAIYFTEYTGKGLRQLLNMIELLPHERFVNSILSGEIRDVLRFDTLVKQAYVNKADKNTIHNFLVVVNSNLQGKALVQADHNKAILNIQTIEVSKGEYGVSAIKFKPEDSKEYRVNKSFQGFVYKKYKLTDLVLLLQGDYAYSPFEFAEGRRSNDNIISETNWIVLDIDESELPMDVLHQSYLSGTSHIVATTSDKTNLHKFRLLLPILQLIGKDKLIYKYVVTRVAEELMLKIDPASAVISQPMFSYSGGIVLNNLDENIPPMDLTDVLQDAAIHKEVSYNYTTPLTKSEQKKEQEKFEYDFEDTFAHVINCSKGRGSYLMYATMKRLERAGLSADAIRTLIHKINNSWSSPMDVSRLENTILKQLQVK